MKGSSGPMTILSVKCQLRSRIFARPLLSCHKFGTLSREESLTPISGYGTKFWA